VEEYRYGYELGKAFRGNNPIKYLQNFGMSKTYCKCPMSVKFFIEAFKIQELRTAKYFKECA